LTTLTDAWAWGPCEERSLTRWRRAPLPGALGCQRQTPSMPWQTRSPSLRPALPTSVSSTVRKTARRSPWQETVASRRGAW